ncbi:MAG: dihydrodipicolinate synthase family protein [Anaerolineae bacterium]|nr:dihydrodipicolinate synthase family protein [Anaerolineae bacterium]
MPDTTMRGLYPILVTPFDEQERIDVESLRSLVDFLIEQGVHGLGVAMGSEVFKFTDAERVLVTQTVVGQAAGRVPVVINTGSNSAFQAVAYSQMAEEHGADAVMLVAPAIAAGGAPETRAYYKAVSDAVHVPIFIQDISTPHVPAELAAQIAEESENVRYIKVESSPPPRMVHQAVLKAGHKLTVFGGAGGNYFVEELRRGSVGTMPYCSQSESFRQVWDLYWAGDEAAATRVFYERILPVNRVASSGGPAADYHVHKEILRQRGAIRTAVVRGPVPPLDDLVRRELQAVIDALYPL